MLLKLNADGSLQQRLEVTNGPRQNQLRALARHQGHWLLAGMRDGPGTHSGDADRTLIRADGYVAAEPRL